MTMYSDETPEPCTQEAREQGCTCSMESVNSASIDPPEPVVSRDCPLHGNFAARDPDAALQQQIDDARDFPDTGTDDWD